MDLSLLGSIGLRYSAKDNMFKENIMAAKTTTPVVESTLPSDIFCGSMWQQDDEGNLKGDMCLDLTWDEAHASGKIAQCIGKTNGSTYSYSINRELADGKLKELGTLNYKKLPKEVNGLIAWGLIVFGKTTHKVAVFRKTSTQLVCVEGEDMPSSADVSYHFVKLMTADEVVKYMPKSGKSTGQLM